MYKLQKKDVLKMKRLSTILLIISVAAVFVSCGKRSAPISYLNDDSEMSLSEQTIEQLGVFEEKEVEGIGTINYEKQSAMWFTYMDYKDILKGKSESEFTKSISKRFDNAKEMGINTIYLHVRAFNDCYYHSEMFPVGEYYDSGYDPLKIMINEAHRRGLSVHAWINPLRCQTDEQMKKLDGRYLIKKWYDDRDKNGTYIVDLSGRWYLNPAYSEVREYIADGAAEIVENYNIDGLHIDDYFYPTSEESFDAAAFAGSGGSDLDKWRLENINTLVKSLYNTVKSKDPEILFGISPQGNIDSNYDSQYADVKKWMSESGYCDYITPQVYFGFENQNCPFRETVDKWKSMCVSSDVKLVIGICTYKIGSEDKWAGSGKNEWIENSGIVSAQAEYAAQNGLGTAVYSYDSTFSEQNAGERRLLSDMLNKKYGGEQ